MAIIIKGRYEISQCSPDREYVEQLINSIRRYEIAQCAPDREYFEQLINSIKVVELEQDTMDSLHGYGYAIKNFVNKNFQYENRFSPYVNMERSYTNYFSCNALLDLPERSAIYVQVRETKVFTPDSLKALRAFVIENGWKLKIDAYIVVHVKSHETFSKDNFPKELHPLLVTVTENDLGTPFTRSTGDSYVFNVMGDANYLVDIWFSHKFPQYKYIWAVEDDARSIAPWSYYLNDVMTTCNKEISESHLILFSNIWRIVGIENYYWNVDLIPPKHSYKAYLMVRRQSKTLLDSLHNATLNNMMANLEHFIPSMASQFSLDVCIYVQTTIYNPKDDNVFHDRIEHKNFHYMNLPPNVTNYASLGMFHCCHSENKDLWAKWKSKDIEYLPMMLMHPVKVD